MTTQYKLYINGEFRDTDEKQKIINPATGEVIAEVAMASVKDAEAAIEAARNAFDNGPWAKMPL
ncbi:aldehyde dehydrogenase family protein, partial [bacterium]